MFAFVRHAGYYISTGSLTQEGEVEAKKLAERLRDLSGAWKEIHVSPATRTQETAVIIGRELGIPLKVDPRLESGTNLVALFPPNEPEANIFVTHLPVITNVIRIWSRHFQMPEPPLTEISNGYLVDPIAKTIKPIL